MKRTLKILGVFLCVGFALAYTSSSIAQFKSSVSTHYITKLPRSIISKHHIVYPNASFFYGGNPYYFTKVAQGVAGSKNIYCVNGTLEYMLVRGSPFDAGKIGSAVSSSLYKQRYTIYKKNEYGVYLWKNNINNRKVVTYLTKLSYNTYLNSMCRV